MSNRTYVCFDCRTTERVPAPRITRTCRNCRKRAEHIYYKFKIPRKDDDKGWLELRKKITPFNDAMKTRALRHLRQRQDELERLLRMVPPAKEQKARDLAAKLKLLKKQADEWLQW